MPWISATDLRYYRERIDLLERQLAAEHETHIKEQRHATNMLLRRANTFPIPEAKSNGAKPEPRPKQPTEEMARAQAIRAEGFRLKAMGELTDAEVDKAIFDQTGMTLAELRQREAQTL